MLYKFCTKLVIIRQSAKFLSFFFILSPKVAKKYKQKNLAVSKKLLNFANRIFTNQPKNKS